MRNRSGGGALQAGAIAAALLAVNLGCPGTRRPESAAPEGQQRLAEAERAAANGDPRALATAGWLRSLVAGNQASARAAFEAALRAAQGPARALALAGRAELREDDLDGPGAARAWAELVEVAPQDPLAELAAGRLLDLEGDSPQVDAVIEELALRLDELRPAPRTARFVREAAARLAGVRDPARLDRALRGQPASGSSEAQAWAALGVLQHWRVAGPFAALRLFDLARATALDGLAPVLAPAVGPAGPTAERTLEFPDGDVGLDQEPTDGELHYAASDLTAEKGGDYLVWLEGAGGCEVRLDGAAVISRFPYPRDLPRAQLAAVHLGAGAHAVVVRWTRADGPRFRLAIVRADGASSDLKDAAPARLSAARADGPCRLGSSCVAPPAWKDDGGLRGFAERALADDPTDPFAAFLLARATLSDDRAAARAAVERAVALSDNGAPTLALRAQATLRDTEVPDRLGRARALRDLTDATQKNPQLLRARLTAAALQRDSERFDDAAQELDLAERAFLRIGVQTIAETSARAAAPATAEAGPAQATREPAAATREPAAPAPPVPPSLPPRLLLARARLFEARGNTALARARAQAALALEAGRCDALQLLADLGRRDGSIADQLRLAEQLLACPQGASTLATLLRDRGDSERAEGLLVAAATARPASVGKLETLAELQLARGRAAAAVATLRAAVAVAPRSAEPLRRLAGAFEVAGDLAAAHAARAAALRLAPGDLSLRRQVTRDAGERLLAWSDRDALALARAKGPVAAPGAPAVRLLDQGAVQLFADGGAVERVHTLARLLDKKGIARFGEAQIPSDAEVLHLRTIKADGRVLEPESIPEKETISLPGLDVGDAVEIDYLRGLAPRGPELPGLTFGAFFFQDEETAMGETTYEVRAPDAAGLQLDGHHLDAAAPTHANGETRWSYSRTDVQPTEPEPHAPSENEHFSWVQAGTGAVGEKQLIASVADWSLLRTRLSSATDALAQKAGGGTPREKLERIYAAVAEAVRGRSQSTDFGGPAAIVLALGRGNRLPVLKAALASAKIPSHLVLVRPFGTDPSAYKFPRADLYSYAILRADLPDGPVWMDPAYRLAPVGLLSPFLRGQDAWVVPEPGEEPTQLQTPRDAPASLSGADAAVAGPVAARWSDGRAVTLDLTLQPDGAARGTGRDVYLGSEAAGLKDGLERMDQDQRKQAVEGMLGRGLRGLALDALSSEGDGTVGPATALLYELHLTFPRAGERLTVPASLLPLRLSRRWTQKAVRKLPLLLDNEEHQHARTTLALPPGMRLAAPPPPVSLKTPFGEFSWSVSEAGGKVTVSEEVSIGQQRVPPERYPEFVAFVQAVDQAQARELRIER